MNPGLCDLPIIGSDLPLMIPTQKRILVIDDEPFNVIGMQMSLSHLGISGLLELVDRAYNGLEGLKKVKNSLYRGSHVYGLVITDISMPIIDGYEVSQEIRSFYEENQAPQPMIVACTGHVEEEFIKRAWLHEIDEILPKPVNIDTLTHVFRDILSAPTKDR